MALYIAVLLFLSSCSGQEIFNEEESANLEKLETRIHRLETAMGSTQEVLTSIQVELKHLRKLSTEVSLNDGGSSLTDTAHDNFDMNTGRRVFIYNWQIHDISSWNETYEEDDKIKSPRFYISAQGFRMFLTLYPVGASSKDTLSLEYLSVYAGIARGTYDDLLKWPFNFRYDISVVDQTEENPMNVEGTVYPGVTCGSHEDNISFQKLNGDNYYLGYGCGSTYLIRRDLLRTRHYIRDDKMLIRLKVYLE